MSSKGWGIGTLKHQATTHVIPQEVIVPPPIVYVQIPITDPDAIKAIQAGKVVRVTTFRYVLDDPKYCVVCGNLIASGRSSREYCSPACRSKAFREAHKNKEE